MTIEAGQSEVSYYQEQLDAGVLASEQGQYEHALGIIERHGKPDPEIVHTRNRVQRAYRASHNVRKSVAPVMGHAPNKAVEHGVMRAVWESFFAEMQEARRLILDGIGNMHQDIITKEHYRLHNIEGINKYTEPLVMFLSVRAYFIATMEHFHSSLRTRQDFVWYEQEVFTRRSVGLKERVAGAVATGIDLSHLAYCLSIEAPVVRCSAFPSLEEVQSWQRCMPRMLQQISRLHMAHEMAVWPYVGGAETQCKIDHRHPRSELFVRGKVREREGVLPHPVVLADVCDRPLPDKRGGCMFADMIPFVTELYFEFARGATRSICTQEGFEEYRREMHKYNQLVRRDDVMQTILEQGEVVLAAPRAMHNLPT